MRRGASCGFEHAANGPSKEAREYPAHLIGGKSVRVEVYGRDQDNRILAVISDGEVNVILLMVWRSGLSVGMSSRIEGGPLWFDSEWYEARNRDVNRRSTYAPNREIEPGVLCDRAAKFFFSYTLQLSASLR